MPSNPVDLVQREGRVHRYNGHAVSKNVALQYGVEAIAATCANGDALAPDVWNEMFELAARERGAANDLVPYWIFPLPDGASIDRHVPLLPLSRDVERLTALRRSLAVYRMVFGQPRQEDLLQFLLEHVAKDKLPGLLERLNIDLSPPRSVGRDMRVR